MPDVKVLQRGPGVDVYYMSSADQVTIIGNGTEAHPLRASGIGGGTVDEPTTGTGSQQLELAAGSSVLRLDPPDEFLEIIGITPPDGFPDGGIITLQNMGVFGLTLKNNNAGAPVGSRIFFRAATGNGYGVNGDGGFGNGGGGIQLVYVSGRGWYILSATGIAP